MKKLLFLFIFVLILNADYVAFAAVDYNSSRSNTVTSIADELSPAGLTPDSPFYFFDTAFDNLVTFFTFGDDARSLRYLDVANERLAEMRLMAERDNTKALENATARYSNLIQQIERLRERVAANTQLKEKIASATGLHQIVLERILETAPEAALEGLQNALERSSTSHRKHLEDLIELDEDSAGQLSAMIIKKRFGVLRDVASDISITPQELERVVNAHNRYSDFLERLEENNIDFEASLVEHFSEVYGAVYDVEDLSLEHLSQDLREKVQERALDFTEKHKEKLRKIIEHDLNKASRAYSRTLENITREFESRSKPEPNNG